MAERDKNANALVVDYTILRTAIGTVTALLPVLLIIAAAANSEPWPQSLSGYYYSVSRNLLVGALCAIGVFLVAYMGYNALDRWITVLAGVFAIGVAFFPTSHQSFHPLFIGYFHQVFATALMIAMAVMALQFTRTAPSEKEGLPDQFRYLMHTLLGRETEDEKTSRATLDPEKQHRNRIYLVCSRMIFLFVAVAYVQNFIPVHWHLFFFCEVALLETFAVSWFVKGGSLLLLKRLSGREAAHA